MNTGLIWGLNHFTSDDVYTRKTFPNCKTEDVYTRFPVTLADMPFSRSPAGHVCETPDKRHCKERSSPLFLWIFAESIYPTPVGPTVRPARNVNREIFLHNQEGFCVGKFGRVVDEVVLDNQPLRKHFRRSRLRYKRQVLLKI